MSCKMCGMCCKAIGLSQSPQEVKNLKGHDFKNDANFIDKNWQPISKEEALRVNPYLQNWIDKECVIYFYRCKLLINNKCSIHGTRQKPHVCTGYPFYDKRPKEDYLFYTESCGFKEELQAILSTPISEELRKEGTNKPNDDGGIQLSKIQIFTDGASNVHHPNLPGGWAYVLVHENMLMCSDWGGESPTTNQRMEVMGAIKGLQNLPSCNELKGTQYEEVEIITDSAYLYRCMTEMWYIDWQFNNWIGSTEEAVKNRDLWEQLIDLNLRYKNKGIRITWTKIRGHKGILYNEVADKLAKKGKLFYS